MRRILLPNFLVLCLLPNMRLFAQVESIPVTGRMGDGIVTLVYDPAGQWWFEHPVNESAILEMWNLGVDEQWTQLQLLEEPNDTNTPLVTTLEIVSADDLFTESPVWCGFTFCELIHPRRRFHLDISGFGSIPPHDAVPNLDADAISRMLSVSGSWLGGGRLEPVDLRIIQFGDVTKDGLLDASDIDSLTAAIRADWDTVPAYYDLNEDGMLDAIDRQVWVEDVKRTYFGDRNLDGEFNSSDFAGFTWGLEYEDAIAGNSTWSEGDWNGDGDFDSSDLVLAFRSGGYEQGPRAPQPTLGDFDHNGLLDLDDINLLLVKIANGHGEGFDLNSDGLVDDQDIAVWVDLKGTYLGDANLDGEFDSSDFVLVFQAGKFEQDIEAFWHEGDWNGDLRFDSADYVAAFHNYCFVGDCRQLGPSPASAVSEPAAGNLVWLVACFVGCRRSGSRNRVTRIA